MQSTLSEIEWKIVFMYKNVAGGGWRGKMQFSFS